MTLKSEELILYYIIGFILLEKIFEIYLTRRQVRKTSF